MHADDPHNAEAERVAVEQFTAHADSYSSSPIINDAAALDAIADLAELTASDRVLDVACGPGIVSCHLAARGATVVGVDLTPAMLELATKRAEKHGLSARTEFVPGSMDQLPFPDGEFSVVVSRYALHHAVSPERAAAEMVRVLRPGGRLVIVDVVANDDQVAAHAHDDAEKLRDPAHIRKLTADEQRTLFEAQGFRVESTCTSRLEPAVDAVLAGSPDHNHDHEGFRHAFEAPIVGFRLTRSV